MGNNNLLYIPNLLLQAFGFERMTSKKLIYRILNTLCLKQRKSQKTIVTNISILLNIL